ncbi:hypothetical protein VYU27_005165 [Nannochloropsis oceanica]
MEFSSAVTSATAAAGTRVQKLCNRYEQDLSVAFPLQALQPVVGSEAGNAAAPASSNGTRTLTSSSWLTDEAYQTYSVRGGTDKWRDNLRRRVEMHKFQSMHGESELVKAIMQTRGRSGTGNMGGKGGGGGGNKVEWKHEQHGGASGGGRGGGKRRRGWEQRSVNLYGGGRGEKGGPQRQDDDQYDEDSGLPGAGGGEMAMGRLIKLGPVAKLRNSSLTLQEHKTFQALSRKQFRYDQQLDMDARPLTAEERQTLEKLAPLVRAEQAKYGELLSKWKESGRAPYKMLEKHVGPHVDAYLQAMRLHQLASIPQYYQMHFKSPLKPEEGLGERMEPAFIGGIKAADVLKKRVHVPPLPVDVGHVKEDKREDKDKEEEEEKEKEKKDKDSSDSSTVEAAAAPSPASSSFSERGLHWSPRDARRWDRMAKWGKKDYVFEEGDILVDFRTLLTLADPSTAWMIPFSVQTVGGKGEGGKEGGREGGKKVLVMLTPLLPPTMSWRERAELFYQEVVPQQLAVTRGEEGRREKGKEEGEEEEEDRTLSLEAWQLAQLKVVVASDRVALSMAGAEVGGRGEAGAGAGAGAGARAGAEAEKHAGVAAAGPEGEEGEGLEALLSVEVDYTLEWSEEEARYPHGLIRHLLFNWVAGHASPYLAIVDGKNRTLAKVIDRREMPGWLQWQGEGRAAWAMGEVVTRLVHILGLLHKQAEGDFVVKHDPEEKEMVVYHHIPGWEGGGEGGGEGGLDLHAYIRASGKAEEKAAGAWRVWKWSSVEQHIPGTFVPR